MQGSSYGSHAPQIRIVNTSQSLASVRRRDRYAKCLVLMADDTPRTPAPPRRFSRRFVRYGLAVAAVLAAFAVRKLLEPLTGTGAPFVLFFGAVVATSLWAGPGPGSLAALLSLPLGAYVFVVRAGYTGSQATAQGALFAIDGVVVVYLSFVMTRARATAETYGEWARSAHEAATQSQTRMRELLELAPDAFFLADLEGRLTDVNQSACRMLGYQREELVGKTIMDIIAPEEVPRLFAVRQALLVPGRVERAEWTHKRKDGSLLPVEVSANILPDRRWQAFVRDISARKRVEDERQVFVSLLDNSSDFIGIADPSGKPIYVNPAGRRMVGLGADHPIETTQIPEYYPPDERPVVDAILKSLTERGRWSGETYFRHWQTGDAIPVSDEHFVIRDPSGHRILGLGTVTRDISEARRSAREREDLLARAQIARNQAELANQQLRESEERFRLTIDEAPIGMALVALDGRFVRVNAALCEIVGHPAEELLRLNFRDITHPDDLGSDLVLAGRLERGEIPRYQLEKRYIRKDGAIVSVMLSASVLRAADGHAQYYIAQVEDITERKRSEEALRFSEARFSGIVSISADAIISVDEDQRIVVFNDGAREIFGYEPAEAMGAPLDLIIPERLRALHRQHVAAFAAGRAGSRGMGDRLSTIMGRRKSGDEFPAEAAISKLNIGGRSLLTVALRDVSERKRLETEQKFLSDAGAILSSSLDYEQTLTTLCQLVVRDLADWCIVDLVESNERARRLKVISADQRHAALAAQFERLPLDRSLPHLVRPALDTRRSFIIEHLSLEELPSFAQSPEHLRILRAISPRSLLELPLLVRGQLLGVLVLISTTSSRTYRPADLRLGEALAERAALAIENGRLYQQALRATRLRDEVLSIVAHDLRNPVAAIVLQAKRLERTMGGGDSHEKPTDRILRSASRMNRLIGDLLDVTAIEAGQLGVAPATFCPTPLLMDAVEAQRALASSGAIDLQIEVPSELPDIRGDQHRLLQVLENLIGNAIKFTPAEGRIVVGAAAREDDVLFWVADTGGGISPENVPHVFDRFWQARKDGRLGAGLGLAVARGIVEAQGGRIWVESRLGHGSVFFFTVPQAQVAKPTHAVH
jgi:PAS domain S-box-containing protein